MKKPSPNPDGRPRKLKDPVRTDVTLERTQHEFALKQPGGLNAYIRTLIAREMET